MELNPPIRTTGVADVFEVALAAAPVPDSAEPPPNQACA